MSVAVRPYTYADLADMPDDGRRYEILGGELLVAPAPSPDHQDILGYLYASFRDFVLRHGLGKVFVSPLDTRLTTYDTVQPDLQFIARNRLGIKGSRAIEGAPDLALEVLSPKTRSVDLVRKFAAYATAGVREYWIVDPTERTIAVYTLVTGQYERVPETDVTARSVVLPGLELAVTEVFAAVE
jgi:Uma2 family endonuclease